MPPSTDVMEDYSRYRLHGSRAPFPCTPTEVGRPSPNSGEKNRVSTRPDRPIDPKEPPPTYPPARNSATRSLVHRNDARQPGPPPLGTPSGSPSLRRSGHPQRTGPGPPPGTTLITGAGEGQGGSECRAQTSAAATARRPPRVERSWRHERALAGTKKAAALKGEIPRVP